MDPLRFDALARSLSAAGTRRRLVRLLTALPLAGPLAAVLGEARTAKERRPQRKQAHHDKSAYRERSLAAQKKGKKKGKKKRKKQNPTPTCQPDSQATTCAGKCATVLNNCGTAVDCGSCACGRCQICQFCNADTGQCVPNESVVGQVCGATHVCQSGGSCACDPVICAGTGPGMSCGGGATPGVCGCTPETDAEACGPQTCGTTQNRCGQTVACTGCSGCCDGNQCLGGSASTSCGTQGATCRTCTPFETCGTTGCEALPDCGNPTAPGPCRVFVTSTSHTGNLRTVTGADQICQTAAYKAGLPGFYQAWLSSTSTTNLSPANRFLNHSTSPYWLLDGTPIANNWADLVDEMLAAPINIDETGALVESDVFQFAWTNTKAIGTRGSNRLVVDVACQNWLSADCGELGLVGIIGMIDQKWTDVFPNIVSRCCDERRLYCFQQA